jgi:apolipoprotein N-acyltransferase
MNKSLGEYSLAVLSAVWLNLCFPIAGPVSVARTSWGWIGLLPLLVALLGRRPEVESRYLLRSFLLAWVCGVVWYGINCYWIYQTMFLYGGLPAAVSAGILLLFSLIMGLYFGLFGWLLGFVRRAAGLKLALFLAPFLWVSIELLGAHLIKVPWDQLGYSQVGNFLLTRLAPYTGAYGISFVLVAVNVLLTAGLLLGEAPRRWALLAGGALAALLLQAGTLLNPPPAPTEATAVLLQENLSVQESNLWVGPEWEENTSLFLDASARSCTPYLRGMPELDAQLIQPPCQEQAPISVVIWPEAPSPFREGDPRLHVLMHDLTETTKAPAIVGNIAIDQRHGHTDFYNAASVFTADGNLLGRYEKIHLVPWGEYIPFQRFFSFAHRLTGNAGDLTHGSRRTVFRVKGHTYGIFICYESIFAGEVRQFAENGAQVLVNISDDGWYGDTSAPWQHLNMARMRAIENRRWLLRDTNTGVTTAIDPYGRLTMSAPRHVFTSLAARYGFRDDLTFYTRYGDLFAMACGIISIAVLARSVRTTVRGKMANVSERQVTPNRC